MNSDLSRRRMMQAAGVAAGRLRDGRAAARWPLVEGPARQDLPGARGTRPPCAGSSNWRRLCAGEGVDSLAGGRPAVAVGTRQGAGLTVCNIMIADSPTPSTRGPDATRISKRSGSRFARPQGGARGRRVQLVRAPRDGGILRGNRQGRRGTHGVRLRRMKDCLRCHMRAPTPWTRCGPTSPTSESRGAGGAGIRRAAALHPNDPRRHSAADRSRSWGLWRGGSASSGSSTVRPTGSRSTAE